jgi:para-nitrobenzyl esterase
VVVAALLALASCSSSGGSGGHAASGASTTTNPATPPTIYQGNRVMTDKGEVVGTIGTGTRSFFGIPFAKPPVGALRWAPPQPATSWSTPRRATAPSNACEQLINTAYGTPRAKVSEDCLYLNVQTPARSTVRRPVLVWFHGGAYTGGMGADYDGSSLARDRKLVVVTVNYRLGVFGFLATRALSDGASTKSSGDYGIEDQRAALEWVHNNIAAFGGDPTQVTIAGQSAGGGSVCAHTISPQSRGLFHAAIMQSGTCAGSEMPTLTDAQRAGDAFAASLGCPGTNAAAAACLRAKPAAQLRDAGGGGSTGGQTALPLGPIVDGHVIPDQPDTLLRSGNFNRVPVIIGYTANEGTIFVFLAYQLKGHPVTAEGYAAAIEQGFRTAAQTPSAILAHYPLDKYRTPSEALAAARTDASVCRINAATELYSSKVPTYAYEFADRTAPFLGPQPPTLHMGVGHGMDLVYLFGSTSIPLIKILPSSLTSAQKKVSASLTGYWSQFAATADPSNAGGVAWKRYATPSDERLVFGTTGPSIQPFSKSQHNCDFWLQPS